MSTRVRAPLRFVCSAIALAVLVAAGAPLESPPLQHAPSAEVVDTLGEVAGGTGGISIDADGNIYSSDFGSRLGAGGVPGTRVFRISPDGTTSVFAEGLDGASGSEIVPDGSFFQSNIRGNTISRISPAGDVTTFASDGFSNPVGIVSDGDGTMYVANCGNNTVQRVTATGESSRFAADELLRCPNGIVIDDAGTLYVANFYNGDVLAIASDGAVSRLATLPGNNNGHLVHRDGVLYVVARTAQQIYAVTLSGETTLVAGSGQRGGDDGPALEATFNFPNDLGFSPDGRYLYVNEVAVDTEDGLDLAPTRIRRIRMAS